MVNNTIYITGHKNPDTDSIVSSISYAYLKQQLGYDAVAIRIGPINQETEFVLNMFHEYAPPLVSDIKTCIRDINFDDVVTCFQDDSMKMALDTMNNNKKKVIAIVDDDNHLLGLSTISDIIKPIMIGNNTASEIIKETHLEQVASFLNGKILHQSSFGIGNGHVYIVASKQDCDCKEKIVITSNDESLQIQSIENGAATLIVSSENDISKKVEQFAIEKNCNLIVCPKEINDISKEIYFACSVKYVMTTNLTSFHYDAYVDDVKQIINNSRFRSYPVLDEQQHLMGLISRYHLFKHVEKNLILVDHNELHQSIEGADEANIIEIVDHHRIGGTKTASPIVFRNESVGCCSTIITKIYRENKVEIPKNIAGLLCSAIISDTINFKSVTCTNEDYETAKYLAQIAGVNLEELGPKILQAGAFLSDKNCKTILHKDMKRYTIDKVQVSISQLNVTDFEAIEELKEDMDDVINDFLMDSGCNIVMMVFSLIDGTGSYVLVKGNQTKKIASALNANGRVVNGFIFLPKMISRKQQILPMIVEAISEAR